MDVNANMPGLLRLDDLEFIAAGAAVLGSGGGGSYSDAVCLLNELKSSDPHLSVRVRDYDGSTSACVLALLGSPNSGASLGLASVRASLSNTLRALEKASGSGLGCVIPAEIGAINSLIPLVAAAARPDLWVVDGDGAGRAVPQLGLTTFSGATALGVGPVVLGNGATRPDQSQTAVLHVATVAQAEALARGVVSEGFGGIAGFAGWPSLASNGFALGGNFIKGTLGQAWSLGRFLLLSKPAPSTAAVAELIGLLTGRAAVPVLSNARITRVTQNTAGGFDTGVVRLESASPGGSGAVAHHLLNVNESLILYSAASSAPEIVAPDSICYYSETTGRGFSNAQDDLSAYQGGQLVSLIKVAAAPELVRASGVLASFAALLLRLGYAGALPAASP